MMLLTHLSRALRAAGRASAAGLPHTGRGAGASQPHGRAILEELEPRVLYSADTPLALLGEAVVRTAAASSPVAAAIPTDADARADAVSAPATASREIAFVDTQVDDYRRLVDELQRQADAGRPIEVHLLDAAQDGIRQIGEALRGREGITAVHVFSHGIDGAVELGGAWLNAYSLEARADEVAQWRQALAPGADLLLYGCDVAADADGRAFVARLGELTGADVAASRDATGSAALGGNWSLEFATGAIETGIALDAGAQAGYAGVLAITVGNSSSAVGVSVSSLSFTHTVNAGANGLLLVDVSYLGTKSGVTVSYGGVALTQIGVAQNPNGVNTVAEMWYLKAPAQGTASVVITLGFTSNAVVGGATSYYGVSQANPLGTFVGTSGSSSTPNATLASSPNEIVVDAVAERGAPPTSADAGQSEQFRQSTSGTTGADLLGASSTRIGAASTTMSWTTSSPSGVGNEWALAAVALKPSNNAPTLPAGATVTLTSTNENTTSSATSVDSLLTSAGWADADAGAAKGIAVTGTAGNGAWQYSTDNGTTWTGFGTVSSSNALLLASTAQVRYQPDLRNGETATFAFKAWDQTSDTASTNAAPAYASTAASGGTTAFSGNNASASVAVTPVNDAPTITNGTAVAFAPTDEDTPSAARTVDSLLTPAAWADVDTGAVNGIAVTGTTSSGAWQYSTDGGTTWTGFGAVSSSNALLLASTAQVRYQPDLRNGETATFAFRAWDQTAGTASTNATPGYGNAGTSGGSSAYSASSASASITVTAINDAPTINNGAVVVLTSTNEDTTSSATSVDSVLGSAGWADVDTGAAKGIAVTGTAGNGAWQYSTDGGTTWTGFGTVSSTSALLLASTAQVRYQPDTRNGETATFAFKAWDQTAGTASTNATPGYGNPGTGGGGSAYSANSASASITVTAVNDAPTISNGAAIVLASTNEDTAGGLTAVDSLLTSASWADADAGAAKGIAVTGTAGNGTWQYSTDGGTTWTGFGTVSSPNALLLASTAQVRYQPDARNGETASFAFKAWDQTVGTASASATPRYGNAGTSGGSSAYSVNSASASITASSLNDAPTLNDAKLPIVAVGATNPPGRSVGMLFDNGFADVDAGSSLAGVAVVGNAATAAQGAWQYSSDGTSWKAVGTVDDANAALVLGRNSLIRFVPAGSFTGNPADLVVRALDNTYAGGTSTSTGTEVRVSMSTAAPGGTTPIAAATSRLSTSVESTHVAPVLSGANAMTAIDEDASGNGGTLVSALISGRTTSSDPQLGIAVTAVDNSNGRWQYSRDGATTWVDFGTPTQTTSRLLAADPLTRVRFVANADWNGTVAGGLTFRAWDQSTGTAGGTADTSGRSNTFLDRFDVASYSNNDGDAAWTSAWVENDGNGGGATGGDYYVSSGSLYLTEGTDGRYIYREADLSGASAATLSLSLAQNPLAGAGTFAIQVSGNGGASFQDLKSISSSTPTGTLSFDISAYIAANTQIRIYANGNGGNKAIAFDEIRIVLGGKSGGATAYSSAVASTSIDVRAVNDAPTINNGAVAALAATDENTPSAARTVDSLLASAGWADVDSGALKGIAVTGTTSSGAWQYSTDGTTWTGFGTVSGTNALLLTSTAQVRYQPDLRNGETATFAFKAWDRSDGASASTNAVPVYASTAASGGTTAFSGNNASASVAVTPVNDAPTITNGTAIAFAPTDEDTPSAARTVDSLLTPAAWADVDSAALKGIAVTSAAGSGAWQYSTDGGTTWTGFGAVSSSNALLLASTSQVRYQPDLRNGETATFAFKAWDQTAGTASDSAAPRYGSTTASGGTTAYSGQNASASVTVSPLNDAPTLTDGAVVALPSTDENTPSGGTTVDSMLTSAGWADVDSGAAKGIAVTSAAGNGAWQYSTDGGATWTGFGAVSSTNALLLAATSQVRYLPDTLNGETAAFAFKAWDQTVGTASASATPRYASTAASGGTTAYSGQNAAASLTVTAVNDAPAISNGATVAFAPTDEDTPSTSRSVDSLLAAVSWADVDSGAVKGIAVTGTSGNGAWQYSTDGSTWTAFGTVSASNALLLASTSQVRYQPDSLNGETASFAFKAWDRTSGSASTTATPAYGSTVSSGGTTAYSSQNAAASLTVTSVNDAPTITNGATVTLAPTDEDTPSSGRTVDSVLTAAGWTDVDSGAAKGIAVTSATGNGTWQYSTDSGITWTGFGSGLTANNALLLASTSQVRYQPDGLNGETASFGFKAWDQTSGTASTNATPAYADPGTGSGTTAFSSQSAATSLTVTSVNDAPTISNGAIVTLVSTDEDTPSSGRTVDSVLTAAGWADVDSGAAKGIAVTSATGNGAWQYSTDNGISWTGFGSGLTANNALLLASTSQVRYQPDGLNGETASFAFKAWDRTSGSASTNATPAYGSTASNGATTAYSSQNASASIAVTPVNDAPTINDGAAVTFAPTDENTTSSKATVDSLLTTVGWADVDSGAVKGIAVTSATGNGAWQYSTDGSTWTAFGTVSASNALLLASTSQVRYQPDSLNGETASFGFKAWDQTSGTASTNATPAYGSTASNGGTTAYSSQNAATSLTVTAVNDAPTISNGATVTLAPTDEDTPSSGRTVDSVLTAAGWADVDSGAAKGIAVTSATGNGLWQYSTDGSTWTAFGTVSATNALLLASTSQVRYQPDGLNGETASFAFKAWDRTSGTASTNATPAYGSTVSSGGTTAYSSQNAATSLTVTPVNDAPTITNGNTVTLAPTDEDTPSSGRSVDSVLTAAGWADVDSGAAKGIAVTSATGNGAWQYSTDGSTWTAFGTVSASNALLLASTSQVRYQPDSLNGETASFGFKAWDQTNGTASTNATPAYGSTASSGGTTAYSSQDAATSLTVTAVNDAPTISNGATVTLASTDEDTPSSGRTVDSVLTAAGWADVDSGAAKGIAVTSATGNGLWQYSTDNGITWTGFGSGLTANNALLLASTSQVRYQPDGLNGETASFAFKAWDRTSGSASTNATPAYGSTTSSGGTTAYSGQNATSSLTVTPVNDAPTISNGATVTLAPTDEDTPSSGRSVDSVLTAAGWADVDSGAAKGIAVTSATGNGAWQYSTDNGISWTGFGSGLTANNALLLASTSQVRYQPDSLNGETASFAFKAWDRTSGTASTNATPAYGSTASNGATTAYSSQNASASIAVTPVNDAPTINDGATVTFAPTDEDTPSSATSVDSLLTSAAWADVDAAPLKGIAVTSATGNGLWQYSTDGSTWTAFGTVSASNALLLASTSQVRYQPDSLNGETASFGFKAWDRTSGTASTDATPAYGSTATSGGTTAYSAANASASLTVTDVDDKPTGAVVIRGDAVEKQHLFADTSSIADVDGLGRFGYQWLRNGQAVAGATGSDYLLGNADVDARISVQVSYVDGRGTPEGFTSDATSPVINVNDTPTGAPVIVGFAGKYQRLVVDTTSIDDADGPGAFDYRWYRNGQAVAGATGTSYTPGNVDLDARLSVRVSYVDAHGTAESLVSAPTAPVAFVNALPVIAVNKPLTLDEGGSALIDASLLQATDDDDAADQLTYSVQAPPAAGRLESTAAAGVTLTRFTQADVDAGRLRYVHDGSEQPADGFGFVLVDAHGAVLAAVDFRIAVTPQNDAPELASTSGASAIVPAGGAAQPVDPTLTVSDVDSPQLTQAVIRIDSRYIQGFDQLTLAGRHAVTAVWNAAEGTLTLSGAASPAAYSEALRSVQFSTSSPASGSRGLSIVVSDGEDRSPALTKAVTLPGASVPLPMVEIALPPIAPSPSLAVSSGTGPTKTTTPPAATSLLADRLSLMAASEDTGLSDDVDETSARARAARLAMGASGHLAGGHGNAAGTGDGRPGATTRSPLERYQLDLVALRLTAEPDTGDDSDDSDDGPRLDARLDAKYGDSARGQSLESRGATGAYARAIDLSELIGERSTADAPSDSDLAFDLLADPAVGSGLIVSASVLWWATRAGGLLAAMMASVPAWRSFDPLPILARTRSGHDGGAAAADGGGDDDGTDDDAHASASDGLLADDGEPLPGGMPAVFGGAPVDRPHAG